MAGNPYAVDFSALGTAGRDFLEGRRKKKIKKEVDSLVKKREGMDTTLKGAVSKQQQLINDTPEMDQTYNEAGLDNLQMERVAAQQGKYNELGGLSPKDVQGMTTEAVDAYKSRIAVERVANKEREDIMTANALLTYEAMGKNPKYLTNWFNETQAHKWGIPDGVERFEVSGDSVIVYEKGKDYSVEGETPIVIPKVQFDQFASAALNPESTKLIAKSLKEGNIPIIVKANQLKESMKYYDTMEEARKAMNISDDEWAKWMKMPYIQEEFKEWVTVETDTGLEGRLVGQGPEGLTVRKVEPEVQKATGAGAKTQLDLVKTLMTATGKRQEALDKVLKASFGEEFMVWNKDLETLEPQVPMIRKELEKRIKANESKTDEASRKIVRKSNEMLNAISSTNRQALTSYDNVNFLIEGLNEIMGNPLGLSPDVIADPVKRIAEVGGLQVSQGGDAVGTATAAQSKREALGTSEGSGRALPGSVVTEGGEMLPGQRVATGVSPTQTDAGAGMDLSGTDSADLLAVLPAGMTPPTPAEAKKVKKKKKESKVEDSPKKKLKKKVDTAKKVFNEAKKRVQENQKEWRARSSSATPKERRKHAKKLAKLKRKQQTSQSQLKKTEAKYKRDKNKSRRKGGLDYI